MLCSDVFFAINDGMQFSNSKRCIWSIAHHIDADLRSSSQQVSVQGRSPLCGVNSTLRFDDAACLQDTSLSGKWTANSAIRHSLGVQPGRTSVDDFRQTVHARERRSQTGRENQILVAYRSELVTMGIHWDIKLIGRRGQVPIAGILPSLNSVSQASVTNANQIVRFRGFILK